MNLFPELVVESILPSQIKWFWHHSFQKTMFYLVKLKYAIFLNFKVTKIERSPFLGHPVYHKDDSKYFDTSFLGEKKNITIFYCIWLKIFWQYLQQMKHITRSFFMTEISVISSPECIHSELFNLKIYIIFITYMLSWRSFYCNMHDPQVN